MSEEKHSYGQILRSSSIIGGAQAGVYVVGLARVKLVAILLGPTGVGLVGLYTSAIGLLGVVSEMGVGPSAVREIARAHGQNNAEEVAHTALVLRRVCWATGLFGWALAILFREQISTAMIGSPVHSGAIAWLGSIVLLSAINHGQLALLQGLRRIGDLARANVLGSLAGSLVVVLIYFALGQTGIILAMIAGALISLGGSYWFARGIVVAPLSVDWYETLRGFRRLVGLGVALMWGDLLPAVLDIFTRSLVTRKFGIEAAGIYQSAWALSGLFAFFVLSAMGTDFYPRLTATIHDHKKAVRAVNEQTEIGILLALPGLLAVLAFAPLAIKLLYTKQFLAAADLLPWMALGVFGRVVSWPLSYVQMATGASRWYAATVTALYGTQALLTLWLVEGNGIVGAAYAFVVAYALFLIAMLWVTRTLIGFSWSPGSRNLIMVSAAFIVAGFAARSTLSDSDFGSVIAGGVLTLAATLFCLRGLAARVGQGHRIVKWLLLAPGGRYLLARRGKEPSNGEL